MDFDANGNELEELRRLLEQHSKHPEHGSPWPLYIVLIAVAYWLYKAVQAKWLEQRRSQSPPRSLTESEQRRLRERRLGYLSTTSLSLESNSDSVKEKKECESGSSASERPLNSVMKRKRDESVRSSDPSSSLTAEPASSRLDLSTSNTKAPNRAQSEGSRADKSATTAASEVVDQVLGGSGVTNDKSEILAQRTKRHAAPSNEISESEQLTKGDLGSTVRDEIQRSPADPAIGEPLSMLARRPDQHKGLEKTALHDSENLLQSAASSQSQELKKADSSASKKPRRRRYQQSLPQLLSDLVSTICKKNVEISSTDDDEKTWKPRQQKFGAAIPWKVSSIPTTWEEVDSTEVEILLSPSTIREAVQWTERAERFRRDGFVPHLNPTSPDFDKAQQFLRGLSVRWVGDILQRIGPDLNAVFTDADADDDGDDLFTEEYNGPSGGVATSTPLLQLLNVIQESSPTLTLEQLFVVSDDSSSRSNLALALIEQAALQVGNVATDEAIPRVGCIGTLLSVHPRVVTAWKNQLSEQSNSMQRTGRDMERVSMLRHLFVLSAFAIPDAGTEATLDSKSRLLRMFEGVKNYPTCVFSRDALEQREVRGVIDACRKIMASARNVGRVALQKCRKDDLLSWLSRVAKLK